MLGVLDVLRRDRSREAITPLVTWRALAWTFDCLMVLVCLADGPPVCSGGDLALGVLICTALQR